MTSPWIAIQSAMTNYCEKYFNAVNIWRSYSNEKLLENRVLVIATICKLFHEDTLRENQIEYKLDTENKINDDDYLPNYESKAKMDYEAFHEAKQIVSCDQKLFKSVGFYFQENLLKAMAGWSPDMLQKSNHKTRENLINLVLLVFRVPESAGVVAINRIHNSSDLSAVPLLVNTIEEDESRQSSHYALYKFLLKTRDSTYIPQLEQIKVISEESAGTATDSQNNENAEPPKVAIKKEGSKSKTEKRKLELETETETNSTSVNQSPLKETPPPVVSSSTEKLNWDKPASLVGLKVIIEY